MNQQQSSCNCGSEGKTTILYSCSGLGSNVGQLSNAAAARLTNEGFGNGSCLAGIGGTVERLIGSRKIGKQAGCHRWLPDGLWKENYGNTGT